MLLRQSGQRSKKIILFAFLFSTQFIVAQDKISPLKPEVRNDTLVYDRKGLEVEPEFPGGIQKFHEFFKSNFKMPEAGIKGKIVAMFVIEKNGYLSRIKVLRPVDLDIKKEIIRVLKIAPNWKPGIQNGIVVRTLYAVEFPNDNIRKSERKKK